LNVFYSKFQIWIPYTRAVLWYSRQNFKVGYRRRMRSFGIPNKVKTSRIKLLYGANDHFKNSIESS